APCPRPSGLAVAYASSSSPWLPSNGSLNCIGSLYGASLASGLGGSRRGGFATSRSVSQPLADDAPNSGFGALLVIETERGAGVVAEIKFGRVAVQVPLMAMLVNADHAALEHREEALNGIGVCGSADVLILTVVDAFVA